MLVLLNDKPSQIIYTMIGFQWFIVFYTAAVRPYKFIIENIYQIVIELTVVVYLAISLLFEKHPPKSNVDFLSFYKGIVYIIKILFSLCNRAYNPHMLNYGISAVNFNYLSWVPNPNRNKMDQRKKTIRHWRRKTSKAIQRCVSSQQS